LATSSFKRYDGNKSGSLSGKELTSCNCMQYDTNADNEVTLEEFFIGKGMTTQEAKKYSTATSTTTATSASPAQVKPAASATTQNNVQTDKKYKVGQKLELYEYGWYKVTVVEVGSGDKEGYYKLSFDKYPEFLQKFYKESDLRLPPAPEPLGPPRAGKYKIIGTGGGRSGTVFLQLGYFTLSGGNSYTVYDGKMNPTGKGSYRFDDASQSVIWLSGPFKAGNLGGDFKSSFQGSKHSIIMNSGTTAENIK
jgi:hypothetical protein